MTDPQTVWIRLSDREPPKEFEETDRLLGYVRINDHSGQVIADYFGKMFWSEKDRSWAVFNYSNATALTTPGRFDFETLEPTHWCFVPTLPHHPNLDGLPET